MKRYQRAQKDNGECGAYITIARHVLEEAFREIECYYCQEGKKEEIIGGYEFLNWIQKMQGNFYIYAMVYSEVMDMSVDMFHQLCLRHINEIKQKAYERKVKNAGSSVEQQSKQSQMGRKTDPSLVQGKRG